MQSKTLSGFTQSFVQVNGVKLSVHTAGTGKPLLLLHGYPQTHATWGKVAPVFAQKFQCIIPDLRGYGESSIPVTDSEHSPYSKRTMAQDMIELMNHFGYKRFSVIGHDRGARVSYRMALDHPEEIEKMAIIEVVPTAEMWGRFNAEMALKAYHWTFLAQPAPLPENMIKADPITYLEWTLKSWTQENSLNVFTPEALESYREQFRDPNHLHALCEDYRAGATLDRQHDEESRKNGDKIKAPLFFLWAHKGFPAKTGNPLGLWQSWAENVQGHAIDCGHFAQEENPRAVTEHLIPFFE
ncbi:alpha/beta hydrolase [uncultured Kiloniella sp.]|uniref:alpha/beta fold hydrolase n=1 Tax=uncultured Kiloniella sp. TaxID=1133091 RepID=UPI00260F74DB|nr:alpha/beta hydrolase [uncultured Kiloniella sp.]